MIVFGVAPSPETVIVAVRSPSEVLVEATAVIVPSPEPDVGVIVSQSAEDVAVQSILLAIVISSLPPVAL